jgi:hypothetical protein
MRRYNVHELGTNSTPVGIDYVAVFWFVAGERGSENGWSASRKVTGSVLDEVIDFYLNLPNPSGRTMALGFTQPLTEKEYQKTILGLMRGRLVRLTKARFMNRMSRQCTILNISQPYRLPWPVTGIHLLYFFFAFFLFFCFFVYGTMQLPSLHILPNPLVTVFHSFNAVLSYHKVVKIDYKYIFTPNPILLSCCVGEGTSEEPCPLPLCEWRPDVTN